MLKKTVTLFICGSLVVGGFSLSFLSAAQNAPVFTLAALANALAETHEQGDPSSLAGDGAATAGTGSVQPHREVVADSGAPLHVVEAMNAEIRERQKAARGDKPRPFVPVPVGTTARESEERAPTEAAGGGIETQAPNDMVYFLNHDITGTEVSTSQRSTIMEPTTVNLGTAVFYTGNWFAAKSTNSGSTFTYINPYTFFPSVNGGFCCDQVSAYAPNQDMALWGLQYVDDGTTNTLRIARAIGSAGIASNSWTYWNFTPQLVGFANGVWFDYPSFTVGANSLYVSSNAFFTSNNLFAGNVIIRLSLAELAAGGSVNFQYFRSGIGTERITEGAGTTIYWGGFTTTTQMRIHRWTEGSGTIFWDNVNLNAFNWLSRDGVATSPDGTNWALRADSRPTGAYVAGGVIGFLWTAKQGGGRPKPYAVHARFNEGTRALISQSDIWNPDYAWMYPSVMPNAAGNLAGTLQIGGAASGTFAYPGTQMWVTDDITGASTSVGALYFVSAGNDGPNNNAWGDYFTVRRHKTRPNTWVSASHALFGGGNGANAVPKYLWFGRERDNPIKASITSPAPGSTLAGPSATFQWNTGTGATQYWLYVGTTGVGSTNILNQDQGTATSRLVTGIPTAGGTVYVRLWTLNSSGWEFGDYTYTAATHIKAAMTSPSPGSTLPGASATFVWNTGVAASQYWLYVGTTGVGSLNIWNQDQGTGTSRLVTGIPTNGGTVYVRLWTLLPSGWAFNDYTYTAANLCVAAAMTSPAGGSTLPGPTVTFNWSAGNGNSQYWLYVGTTPGGAQILNQSQGTALTRTVNGIPTDGLPVYVRLWSFCASWTFADYTYNTTSTALTGRLRSPTPRSVLSGAAPTFTWIPGLSSTQYWLYIGTSRGAFDLWNENQGAGTTRTVAGLPVDGRRIYVRLWSLLSGVWHYLDYDFTAAGTARARLSSPAEGSVLGTSANFAWSAGSSATQYWVYLGTTLGGTTLLNQNMGTATSVAAAGLPTDRGPLFLRLWSLVSGSWVYNDYLFRAYDGGSVRGRLASPIPESILIGSSATFTWNAGAGATQYWLYAGTTRGGLDILNQNQGTNLSASVSGILVNGATTYIRLWTFVGGSWVFNDYEYTASP